MSRNAAKISNSLWQQQVPVVQLVPLPDSAGHRLLNELQNDSIWQLRGNVLYQGVYMVKADYIVAMSAMLSGNEQEYATAYQELTRQEELLDVLKEDIAIPAYATEIIDIFWPLFEQVHDMLRFVQHAIFWYGPGTGYENGLISQQEYIARVQEIIESSQILRIEAVIITMQRTIDPWKVVHDR